MARVYLIKKPKPNSLRLAYTVDQAVGQGCPNRRDDVLLVQFFLKVAMEDATGSPGYRPPGEKPITVDGTCGRQTVAYIKFFQEEGNRRNPGIPTTTDQRVDPVLSGTTKGALAGTFYTILALNVIYKERRGDLHLNISDDPLFPAELTKSLFIS
jgi:hypothetical protein